MSMTDDELLTVSTAAITAHVRQAGDDVVFDVRRQEELARAAEIAGLRAVEKAAYERALAVAEEYDYIQYAIDAIQALASPKEN